MDETQLRSRPFVVRYSLSLILLVLFLLAWGGQLWTEWGVYRAGQEEHGQPAQFWSGDFWTEFGQSTLENWQSEFLQLTLQVSLTAWAYHLGSSQSREGDETMKRALARIEERLDGLAERQGTEVR